MSAVLSPDASAGRLVQPDLLLGFLRGAGLGKASVIRVTGPSALSALLWLCRHGYDQVGYVRADVGAPHEEEPDAILVAHTCGDLELKRALTVARLARPGGVFIFRLRTQPGSSPLGVEWLLEQHGFAVERRLDGQRRALVVARRVAALQRAA